MTRGIISSRERKVAWRLTRLVLIGAFAIGALAVSDIVRDLPDGDDATFVATTTKPPVSSTDGSGTDDSRPPETTEPTTTTTWEPARSFTLVATGELLVHEYVADRAADYGGVGTWDFRPMFRLVRPILAGADVALCHLETPLSADNSDLAYYPGFRVPFELADAIADAGWDGCSVASNHSLDAGTTGVTSTLDHLRRAGVATTGMATTATDDGPATFEADGISIAHLSYTDLMNGGSLPTEPEWLVPRVDAAEILTDAAAARASGAEFVVLSLHWGPEYETAATSRQVELVDTLLASPDVDLLLGHGAHVPQPVIERDGKYAAIGLDLGWEARVIPELERHLTEDPLSEEGARLLALALYRVGRQRDALAQLRAIRDRLADELGIDPGPALRTLEAKILEQSDDLFDRPRPPALPTAIETPRRHTEFPAPVSRHRATLIGRSAEVQRITAAAATALTAGLRTIWLGAEPGAGKTTLTEKFLLFGGAIQMAGQVPRPDGS